MMSSNTQEGWDTNGSITTYTKHVRITPWHRLDLNDYYITIIHIKSMSISSYRTRTKMTYKSYRNNIIKVIEMTYKVIKMTYKSY